MFLYLYGGIYIDMDMEVLHDFYGALAPDRISLVESPFQEMETVQNSLMASPPKHPFWMDVLREISSTITVMRDSVLDCTGPRMLSRLYDTYTHDIRLLPASDFNPQPVGHVYNATRWTRTGHAPYTRHLCTATWRR
jgi:mannosyltransferase OCH1-like enzyme